MKKHMDMNERQLFLISDKGKDADISGNFRIRFRIYRGGGTYQ